MRHFPRIFREYAKLSVLGRDFLKNGFIIAPAMAQRNTRTALLLFTRSPHTEHRVKSLVDGPRGVSLLRRMVQQTLRVLYAARLPVVVCQDHEQVGDTFGERLTHAVEGVFAQGYGRVIVVGNDTPHLHASHILSAAALLNNYDCVIGPATDGGVYLLGLHRAAYVRDTFIQLAWETPQLAGSLRQVAAAQSIHITALLPLADVDTAADWQHFLGGIRVGSRLWRVFRAWIHERVPPPTLAVSYATRFYASTPTGRGPPLR